MSTSSRVAVIIPARNEGETIAVVVREVRGSTACDVIVADNGSTDDTAQQASDAGALVVSEPIAGYGRACTAGFAATDANVLVFMDGDGSDVAGDIPALLEAIEGGADLALGVRKGPRVEVGAIAPAARFGNWLACSLLKMLYGQRLHDLSPLKAVRRDLLERAGSRELTYGWTVELLGRAVQLGARIVEVETGYRHRAGGTSKVSGDVRASARAGVRILATIWRLRSADRSTRFVRLP